MKTSVLSILLLTEFFGPGANGQEASLEPSVAQWMARLTADNSGADSKGQAAWQLGLLGPSAKRAIPELVKILASADSTADARVASLNALGHIGVTNHSAIQQLSQVLSEHSKTFKGTGSTGVVNGSFENVERNANPNVRGAFGETMFAPGSLDLSGWRIYGGFVSIQDEGARPGGKNSIELGSRDVPGCVSQTILTSVGKNYTLKFYTCTGRAFAHFNRQVRVRVGSVDKLVDCVVGPVSEPVTVPFQATSAFTTISFCGVGNSGFGPMIDDVAIESSNRAAPSTLANDSSRLQQLDAIARRIQRQEPRGPITPLPPSERDANVIDLLSEAGQPFLGHQLESFDRTGNGILSTKQPSWISLYQTERRAFTLTGEVRFGGNGSPQPLPGDWPDGFALFLREWDSQHRYRFDARHVSVQQRRLHGKVAGEILRTAEFEPPQPQQWIEFRAHVSESMIDYRFGGHVARLPGPLDMDGANKLAIAPGTQIRNLRISIENKP